MKTTVRATVIIPGCQVSIQRLYDCKTFFKLEKEVKAGKEATDFIEQLIAQGGKIIDTHEFIDDDDFQHKTSATFEYIAE